MNNNFEVGNQNQFDNEKAEKIIGVVEKAQLIYKRIMLGIIITILFIIILFDTVLVRQTIISKDYIETTAVYVSRETDGESDIFDDCIYTFIDKQENKQEIIVSISKDDEPEQEIKIKYNEKNPQDYYEEGSTMDKSGIIWYVVKIVALILLIITFFNKRILNRISISN